MISDSPGTRGGVITKFPCDYSHNNTIPHTLASILVIPPTKCIGNNCTFRERFYNFSTMRIAPRFIFMQERKSCTQLLKGDLLMLRQYQDKVSHKNRTSYRMIIVCFNKFFTMSYYGLFQSSSDK
jgi:hypothetical protein